MTRNILVCDDDVRLARMVGAFLTGRGFQVEHAVDGESALAKLETSAPDVLLTDVRMPGGIDGFTLLQRAQAIRKECAVVMMTGYGSVEDAGRAKALGAVHYLQKPFPPEDLINILDRLERGAVGALSAKIPELVGESPPMREVFARILQVANTDLAVLIQGETGTGKELVSLAIHRLSFRNRAPFVAVNCATLEHDLFESELFGHTAGAFTGATKAREGLIESASGGTIFLDEIGEISNRSQAKLLRAIETGEVRRLGDTTTRKVDVRVVAATNVPLREAAAGGHFRSDLYFRIAAFTITLPPLRERRADIALLASTLLNRSAALDRRVNMELSSGALQALQAHDWPGNVRELDNVLRSAAAACSSERVQAIDTRHLSLPNAGAKALPPEAHLALPKAPGGLPPPGDTGQDGHGYREARDRVLISFDRAYFSELLVKTGGNISKAARIAGIDRKRLRQKLEAANLESRKFR